ncbi:MAG TPA: pteridine-dependent deoxygenase [Rudaea sp.]
MTQTDCTDAAAPAARQPNATVALPPLEKRYDDAPLETLLADPHVLAVFGFGGDAPAIGADPRYFRVALQPVDAHAPFEVWRSARAVAIGVDDDLRWSDDGFYRVGLLEVDEAAHGGIAAAAEYAYRRLSAALEAGPAAHLLRCWNYLDAINVGDGDEERYRQFCNGRAAGMLRIEAGYPAATAIGVRDGRRVLQVYWLAARAGGAAFENPRQVSAWRYPRQYGPTPPSFARAMRAPTLVPQVYISGTAAVVGHASHHDDDFAAQLDETLKNLDSLLATTGVPEASRFGTRSLLKVYVRRATDAALARARLRERLPAGTPFLLLQGDVCRRELLVEIDGIQSV